MGLLANAKERRQERRANRKERRQGRHSIEKIVGIAVVEVSVLWK